MGGLDTIGALDLVQPRAGCRIVHWMLPGMPEIQGSDDISAIESCK